MAFLQPKLSVIQTLPFIVYAEAQLAGADQEHTLQLHLAGLVPEIRGSPVSPIAYAICFAWKDKGDLMIDAWLYGRLDSWGSGPLVDVIVFRELIVDRSIGVGSGNSLIVLGLEETARRSAASLEAYLAGVRPRLPADLDVQGTAERS